MAHVVNSELRSVRGLIIYPPNQLMGVETPRPDGSLGPLYLAAALEAHGIETDVLDASVGSPEQTLEQTFYRNTLQENGLTRIGMTFDEIADYVSRKGYSFICISSNFTPQTKMAFQTAAAIKQACPKIKIYAGGVNARALNERFLRTGLFDAICLTEGELVVPRIVTADFTGKTYSGIAGIAFLKERDRSDSQIVIQAVNPTCFPNDLDDLPLPAWHKLPFDKYEHISSPHGVDVTERGHLRYAPIMTSRGCPFRCAYCHISTEKHDGDLTGATGKLRLHSIERVLHEIDVLENLGVKRLYFEDDSLLAKRDRVKEIFNRVKSRNLSISNVNGVNLLHLYTSSSREGSGKWELDFEFMEILMAAGFDQLVFPVESGNKRVIRKYATNKVNLDRMDLPALMSTLTKFGFKAPANMMIGFPDETEAEIMESVAMAKRLMEAGAPYVTFFIPIPFPGSKLYEMALEGGHLDPNFDTDIMNWKRPVMKNTAVPPSRLEELRDWANQEVNTQNHLEKRLKQSMGYRWQSNPQPEVT